MAHKVLPTPTSGADPNKVYGTDWNKLTNMLQGLSTSDPFTLNVDVHTFKHSSTNEAGDLLKGDGTKFIRWAKGTALQVPRVNSAGTDLEWYTPIPGTDDKVLVREAGVQVGSTARYLNFITGSEFLIAEDVANTEIEISIAAGGITNTHLAGSIDNTKLLQITDKAKLHGSILYNDVDNSVGAHYLDFSEIGAPASPGADVGRLFFDSADEHLKIKVSTGAVIDLGGGSGTWDPALAEVITNKRVGNYLDFDRVAAPANPGTDIGRVYHKQIDSNNDGMFVKLKKAGSIVEVRII